MRDRSPQKLWETALGQLELQVTRPNFDTWLRNTTGLRLDSEHFVVGVPSDFAIEWLRSRMGPLIDRTVSQIAGGTLTVSFHVLGAPALSTALSPDGVAPSTAVELPKPQLDPALTFDTFTVVDSNRIAYRAARKVATAQADYNPLVLLAPPGLGKSHLLHAIGHDAAAHDRRVLLLTGEAFVDRYAKSVRAGQPQAFRDAFLACDLLLLDDLQFLASRPASQEQFLHIFNILHTSGRPLAVTIDTPPDALAGLSQALASRLQAGLTAQLAPPDAAERLDILRALSTRRSRSLPEETLRLIAGQPFTSVRQLEGAFNRVVALTDISDASLTTDQVRQVLQLVETAPARPTPAQVLDTVCRHFHLSQEQVAGPSRARDITYARHIAMYLMRRHYSLADIGRALGGRDHSTVLSGVRRIEGEQASLEQTQSDLSAIESALKSA